MIQLRPFQQIFPRNGPLNQLPLSRPRFCRSHYNQLNLIYFIHLNKKIYSLDVNEYVVVVIVVVVIQPLLLLCRTEGTTNHRTGP